MWDWIGRFFSDETVVCPVCQGRGEVIRQMLVDGNIAYACKPGAMQMKRVTCPRCEGGKFVRAVKSF